MILLKGKQAFIAIGVIFSESNIDIKILVVYL